MNRVKEAQKRFDLIIIQRAAGLELARRIGKPAGFHYKRAEDKMRELVVGLAGELQAAKEMNDILTERDREMRLVAGS